MARIGVLILNKKTERKAGLKEFDKMLYTGLRIILSELKEPYEYCSSINIKDYDFVLCSLTSIMDVENIIYTLTEADRGKVKIIVGGFGCINIRCYSHLIDIAVFGRAEGQINDILAGKEFDNVWRKEKDPDINGRYIIRQAEKLQPRENSIGCPRKCYFCQYTWTRKSIGGRYDHGGDLKKEEDDFEKIKIKTSGRYTSAFDGMSENTRLAINKKWCTIEKIKNKIDEIYNNKNIIKPVIIKLFQIIGYPWESEKTFFTDIDENKKMWKSFDRLSGKKRICFMYFFTPFSPEPLTPMQYSKANIIDNWRYYLGDSCMTIYGNKNTDIESFTLPQINSTYTLAKRIIINRCDKKNKDKILKILLYQNKKLKADDVTKNIINYLGMELFNKINPDIAGFNYLSTYLDIDKYNGIAEKKYNELHPFK